MLHFPTVERICQELGTPVPQIEPDDGEHELTEPTHQSETGIQARLAALESSGRDYNMDEVLGDQSDGADQGGG